MIETIVAMFILVSAIVSCLALALFALRSSSGTRNQTIATNLAREGIEIVRMMRDSNWMAAEDTSALDLQLCTYPSAVQRPCYPDAFDAPNDMNTSSSANAYRLIMRVTSGVASWNLDTRNGSESYNLCLQPNGTYQHNTSGAGVICGEEAQFARKITISTGSIVAPYTTYNDNPTAAAFHSPEKRVTSTVIWKGKGCPAFTANPNPEASPYTNSPCRISVTESLTNWKDYR